MKLRRSIGMLIVILLMLTAVSVLATPNVQAANSSYILGITNIRENGGAYGIGGPKSDNTPNKKVWKIVSYPTKESSSPDYSNAFYCVKAEIGFAVDGNQDVSQTKKEYNVKLDMKKDATDVLAKLNTINSTHTKQALSQENYNKIVWILDHVYLPKSETAAQDKTELMKAAGITDSYSDVFLTDDDIEVIQQLAIWYFTNADDTNYHKGEVQLDTLLFNDSAKSGGTYKSFADYDDRLSETQNGRFRQEQADKLYQYFINNASSTLTTTKSPAVTVTKEATAVQDGERFIVGPFKIEIDNNAEVELADLKVVDQSGNTIPLTGDNKLLNATKAEVKSGNLNDVKGQNFYISLPLDTNISTVKFVVKGNTATTQTTYYTTEQSTAANEQPVVLVERVKTPINEEVPVVLPKAKYLDLALRKSITKIGENNITNRMPQVDTDELKAGTDTTAKYNHPKNDLIVETGDFIEYTITVYNEGGKNGYAAEIKDYLPVGIEFVSLVSPTENYTATSTKNEDGTETVTITNKGNRVLQKYENETLDSESFTIRCKINLVAENTNQRLVNIAEITKYYDSESRTQKDVDRDSQVANFPSDKKNNNYTGNGKEGDYIPGQQDDDDFEPVVMLAKVLDLALRKSITKIGETDITDRIPQVDTEELAAGTDTTAKYNHPKNDLEVNPGDFIEYTITVYNEGQKNGYAAEIKDYLPAGIEFVSLVSPTNKYTATSVKNADGTETITIKNVGKTVLNKYTQGTPDSESFVIRCKVTAEAGKADQRLVNIAEITRYYDSESKLEKAADRDSQIENFPSNKKNNDYTGNGKEGNYIPGQQDDDDFEPVVIPGKRFDLALRKFIVAVNGEKISTSREPVVDVTPLLEGKDTAIYNHPKAPLQVKVGDIVTYTIRVYNEGELAGYATEVTDHLPEGLEFLPDDEENIANGWVYDEEDVTLRTIKSTHLSKEIDDDNIIQPFDGKTLYYKDLNVNCKIKSIVISGQKITNIADITDFTDKNGEPIEDDDSQENNVVIPPDEQLPDYKDDQIEKGDEYIPGQQDDDDFEKVEIQIFDLALRKFITAINNDSVTSRIPQLSMGENGIVYNHPKTPVLVRNGDIVTYTLRIFNEGELAGYAKEVTDNLPEGLEFLPDNDVNKTYRWKMIDKDGNETQDVTKAVKVTTDYLSKEQEKEEGQNLLNAFNKELGITDTNPDYRDIKIAFKVTEPNTSDRILTNIAEISEDTDKNGNPVEDVDSVPGNNKENEDDIDKEHLELTYFDLALRKFITKIDDLDVNNRYPVLALDDKGNITYTHSKTPLEVENGDIVIYTLRVYNEGKMAGYAKEITDNLPEGLEFLPDNDINKVYRWKMIDEDGNETQDVSKAVKVTTDYLSKEQEKEEGQNLLQGFNKEQGITDTNPDHRDIQIAFKVTEPNTSDRILTNIAQISEDTDKDGNPVEDEDSTPGNNEPEEDDQDEEHVKVKYFDLSLKKWVSKAIVIENGKQTVTETGHTGDENPEAPVKVDIKAKNIKKVTVKFEYTIKITNEGEIEGYAIEIKEHIPEGLKFDAKDNPDWLQNEDGTITTKKLENTLLKPGESATVKILLTWINGNDNLGLKVNVAEISEDKNDSNTPDIDSTPDNNKPEEDDQDDAPVLLGVRTGEEIMYIALTSIILVTIAGGVFLIKKYVL